MDNLRSKFFALAASIGMLTATAAMGQETYPVYFPAYGEDLPYGHFWHYFGNHAGGAKANDFVGIKFNEATNKWEADPIPSVVELEDTVLGGIPVRAAADGEVIACWREYPDAGIGEHDADTTIELVGGNNLVVRAEGGVILFYAHLKQNSIPVSLCPVSGNAQGYPFDVTDRAGWFPKEYIVPSPLRAKIHTGQFLGLVGHSGNSKAPHLHFHVQKYTEDTNGVFYSGDTVFHRFYGASKVQGYSNGAISENWSSVNGHVLNQTIDDGKIIIMPEEGRKSAISSRNANRLDVFTRSRDRQLQIKIWDGQKWSGWTKLGGALTSNPACTSWSSTRIDCFARGTNMRLQHIIWTEGGGWSDWNDHGGLMTSAPAVASRGENKLDIFVRGKDFGLWHKVWNGSAWSNWKSLGGKLSSTPACIAWSQNRIDCVARGRNNALWHIFWNGQKWSEWKDHGGILTSAPAIASRGANRLDIFARGQNNHLWMKQWDNGAWSEWSDLGGVLTSGPSAVSWGNSRVDVQAVGQNGNLWHRFWTPGGWSKWTDNGPFFD